MKKHVRIYYRWKNLISVILILILAANLFAQSVTDKKLQADTLFDEGVELFQQRTGQSYLQALEKLKQAGRIYEEIGDKSENVGISWIVSGLISLSLGRTSDALQFYEKSLKFFRQTENKLQEAATLNNIGQVYVPLGENQKALDYYSQALQILRQIKDEFGEATILNNIGFVYSILGENQKALEYYNQALLLRKQVNDVRGQATTLNNIGKVYDDSDDNQNALEYYKQALPLFKEVGDKSREATTLNNIGLNYSSIGEYQKSLEYYNQALQVIRQIGDKNGEAITLMNVASLYSLLGVNQNALEYYNRALQLIKQVGSKSEQAQLFSNLMYFWNKLKNPQFAIFYGKQSARIYQELRFNIQGLDKEIQKTYLKSVEYNYRTLSEILIQQNRLEEAQQTLNAFKDEQLFDFEQAKEKKKNPLNLTLRETDYLSRYEKVAEPLGIFSRELEELKQEIGNRQPSVTETKELSRLETQIKNITDEFTKVLKQAEIEFSKPKDEKDKIGEIPDLRDMQTALREISANTKQKAVAIYQLVGEEDFHLLVITADEIRKTSTPVKNSVANKIVVMTMDEIKEVSTMVTNYIVNEKALDFWALLQSPVYNPNVVGKELYDVVFKPLESVLPKDTKTILWSPDGNLRYVPMAALFDGKQYLAERFNHVNFTRADKERMTSAVKPVWTASGFGTSDEKTVELLGSRISFEALPGVGEEFKLLFKPKTGGGGIFAGEVLQNAAFNKKAMLDALRLKRPLVHIASHFSFRAGDEARSFLLLGDGTAFTLEEMKREPNLFQGVELLTLSACNTAAQQTGANGREVDGFAELAQRLGAGAVMATLWSVADNSTPWLMREFYDLKLNGKKNKAESLREAQISLLKGTAKLKPSATRTDLSPIKIVVVEKDSDKKRDATRSDVFYVNKKDAPLWDKEKHPPFAHPFYWSPFILFGNWK